MSIWRRSLLKVFMRCSGSLWIPTQQPFTNILVALGGRGMSRGEGEERGGGEKRGRERAGGGEERGRGKGEGRGRGEEREGEGRREGGRGEERGRREGEVSIYFAMAEGAISSKFSMLHSSKNSRMGLGWLPTLMYAISARFFTKPTAWPCGGRGRGRRRRRRRERHAKHTPVKNQCTTNMHPPPPPGHTSGVSAGHIIPQCVLWSWRGRASFPSRPIGELSLRRCERVEAKVSLLRTWETPALVWWALRWSPQLPVAKEYFKPSVIVLVLIASSRLKSYSWCDIHI